MILRRTHEMTGGGDLNPGVVRQLDTGNAILNVKTQVADYALDAERLAVLCAWNGRQEVALDGRRVFVDDDTWMTVPACPANVRIRGAREVHALTILFRRGMPEETLGALITPEDRLLESGEVVQSAALPFMPHLYTHDRSVTPALSPFFLRALPALRDTS